jgi:hypothetical protein
VHFQGEERDDCGHIIVANNKLSLEYDDIEEITLEDFSDDELIEELKNRGYVVGKAI